MVVWRKQNSDAGIHLPDCKLLLDAETCTDDTSTEFILELLAKMLAFVDFFLFSYRNEMK
jgi:hypothetical protein